MLSKSVDNAELGGAVETLEGRTTVNIEGPQKSSKGEDRLLGWNNPMKQHGLVAAGWKSALLAVPHPALSRGLSNISQQRVLAVRGQLSSVSYIQEGSSRSRKAIF